MALERKDIRGTVDFDIHEALTAICDRDGVGIGEFVEREIKRAVMEELHRYMLSRNKFQSLGLIQRLTEKPGKGH